MTILILACISCKNEEPKKASIPEGVYTSMVDFTMMGDKSMGLIPMDINLTKETKDRYTITFLGALPLMGKFMVKDIQLNNTQVTKKEQGVYKIINNSLEKELSIPKRTIKSTFIPQGEIIEDQLNLRVVWNVEHAPASFILIIKGTKKSK